MIRQILIINLLLLVSCNGSQNKKTWNNTESTSAEPNNNKQALDISNPVFSNWINYYKANEPGFSISKFTFERTDQLEFINGSIYGIYDKEFDSIYASFLIHSPDKKHYLDMDSYQWVLDDKKKAAFEVDQEINLVDLEKREIKRIAFYGSSAWVEDAFWQNDSMIYLLGNSYNASPFIRIININSKISENYSYADSLSFSTAYAKLRLKNKGIQTYQ